MPGAGQRCPARRSRPGLTGGPCHPAGAPPSNATFFCSPETSRCYQLISKAAAHTGAEAACVARGGHLVSYGSLREQLLVERYMRGSASLPAAVS